MRPPGYEPGELPTAPLRDVKNISNVLNCECKVTAFILIGQIFKLLFYK